MEDILVALGGELDAVDPEAVSEALDDASRPLFGLATLDADAQASAMRDVLDAQLGFRAAGTDPRSLLLDGVLERRCGHPLLLACVGHELARRAGVLTSVHSCERSWLLRFHDADETVYVAFGDAPDAIGDTRRHCSHELAFASLVALEASYSRCGYLSRSRRAAALRQHLPVTAR